MRVLHPSQCYFVLQRPIRDLRGESLRTYVVCLLVFLSSLYVPGLFAQGWEAIGPWGTEVQALTIAPSSPEILYLGDAAGSIYKTRNGGRSWRHMTPVAVAVRSLAVHPDDPDIVYAGVDLFGVMRSTDGGRTWQKPDKGLEQDPFVYALAIDPHQPGIVYAGTFKSKGTGGVYKSTDGGRTWQSVWQGVADANVLSLCIDPRNPQVLYAGMYNGRVAIYRSNDGGRTWKPSAEGLGQESVFSIQIHPRRSHILYAATSGKGVYLSENGGATWRPVNRGLINLDVRALVIDPENPQILYAAGALGVYRSADGGRSWRLENAGLTNQIVVQLAHHPSASGVLYAGTIGMAGDRQRGGFLGTVFRTTDGGRAWEWAGRGLASADVRAIRFDPFDHDQIHAAVFGYGVFSSADRGRTWNANQERRNLGLSDPQILDLSLDPQNPGVMLAATLKGGIFKTHDGGEHWRNVWNKGRVQMLVRDPQNALIVYAASFPEGVLRSDDGGTTWKPVGLNVPGIFALAVDPQNPRVLYAGVNAPAADSGGIYKSTDGGVHWERRNQGITNTFIRAIAIDPQNPQIVYAGTLEQQNPSGPAHFYRSTNGGLTWERITDQEFETYTLVVDPQKPTTLYSGKLIRGVFRSTDGGVTWEDVNRGLENSNVLAMTLDPQNPHVLYIGTVKGGIFRRDFSLPVIGHHSRVLSGNAHQAVVPETSYVRSLPPALDRYGVLLEYGIPEERRVELEVLGRDGTVLKQLEADTLPPGRYRVFWDGTSELGEIQPKGVYVCRLFVKNRVLFRKIVLW